MKDERVQVQQVLKKFRKRQWRFCHRHAQLLVCSDLARQEKRQVTTLQARSGCQFLDVRKPFLLSKGEEGQKKSSTYITAAEFLYKGTF